jgi:hypothetical protein
MSSIPPNIEQNDAQLLSWLDTALRSGLALLKREAAYQTVAESIAFLNGQQGGSIRPSALSRVTFNRLRKIVYEIVSSMTDVRPIWNYQTYNNKYKEQADVLNKLVRNWWRNSYADRRMQDALMYACAGGTGYLKVEWNPWLPGGGNIDLIPLDPRDVLPINPAFNTSVQQWQGVAIRKTVALPSLRQRYPEKFYKYKALSKSWFDPKVVGGSHAGGTMEIVSPVLDKLFSGRDPVTAGGSEVDLVHVFIRDDSMNTGLEPKLMGRPGTNWCYEVYPLGAVNPRTGKVTTEEEAKLYPRGRLILCTPEGILEDIPNPYWHGLFPLIKFTLDPQPWSILGSSLVADGRSIQESLNEVLRGVEDAVKQWLRRTVVGNSAAIGKGMLNKIDSRISGQKLLINPSAGDGVKFIDGPQLPEYIMKYAQFLLDSLDDNSGVKGLRELAQLKQMPSADTIEKFLDAQSPLLRLRSAQMEQSLAELAEMAKVMIFQYYDAPRRVQILGADGITMEDFDYDPNFLVPSLRVGDDGYRPEYDAMLTTRSQRAEKHHRNFTFSVARNSFLNASHTQQKMFYLQLARMPTPMIDPWTLLEALDVPNLGPQPDGSVFDRIRLAQQVGLYPPPPGMMPPPGGGAPPSNKPEGRPPSGQTPPQFQTRTDENGGQRQVVSESR